MVKLIHEEYRKCREQLSDFRATMNIFPQNRTIIFYPFDGYLAHKLFNLESIDISICKYIGRHLVLKITDELLDEGDN